MKTRIVKMFYSDVVNCLSKTVKGVCFLSVLFFCIQLLYKAFDKYSNCVSYLVKIVEVHSGFTTDLMQHTSSITKLNSRLGGRIQVNNGDY